jgi:hypothetical protein
MCKRSITRLMMVGAVLATATILDAAMGSGIITSNAAAYITAPYRPQVRPNMSHLRIPHRNPFGPGVRWTPIRDPKSHR